jgi:hypothetical protein
MSRPVIVTLIARLFCALVQADEPAPSAEFKLAIAFRARGSDLVDSAEYVAIGGRVFQYSAKSQEIVVVDPKATQIELLDLARHVQARVRFDTLDRHMISLRKGINAKAMERENEGNRAGRLAAAMARDLLAHDPAPRFDASTKRLTLHNPHVQVDAAGVADADRGRLDLIRTALETTIRLSSFREPQGLPPFARLEAIDDLMGRRRLRPTEIVATYRLQGPPDKYTWTYRLDPKVTARDREGIARLDIFRSRVPLITFAEYENPNEP